ncbi:MAG: MlaD family protein [Thermodesulfobacteriota bacterium]
MKNKLTAALVIFIIALAAFIIYPLLSQGKIVIKFDRAPGVVEGSKLLYKGTGIGVVSKVNTDDKNRTLAYAAIHKDYRETVNSSAAFIVEGPEYKSESKTVRNITVEVLDPNAPPLKNGQIVEGYSSRLDFMYRSGKKTFRRAMKDFKDMFEEPSKDKESEGNGQN